jgi:HD superfamily phosphohydrolase
VDKITLEKSLDLEEVVELDGDLLLMPPARLPNLSEALALQRAGVIDTESSMLARNTLAGATLQDAQRYAYDRKKLGKDPDWIWALPRHQRAFIRWSYATSEEEPLAIVNTFPFTGLTYMVREGGLCDDIQRAFGLFRLSNVKQLGFLQQPWAAVNERHLMLPISTTTRYLHSLDVMTIATVIGQNVGLNESDLHTLRVAAFTHDWGTPAGGDSVKLVDPVAFDEDANYHALLKARIDTQVWKDLKEKYAIDEEKLVLAILNKGLLGQILDVADKLAYVARDMQSCLQYMLDPEQDEFYVGTRALNEIIRDFPYVCSIWDSIERVGDSLVFTNTRRLIAFLKVRIVMFRELYYHPRARFGEYLISRLLVKRLYDDKKITRDELLKIGDDELMRRLEEAYKTKSFFKVLSGVSRMETFTRTEDAERFSRALRRRGKFTLIEDHLRLVKTGTHFLVHTKQGPLSLGEAEPGDAQELKEMATMLPAVHVYYFGDYPDSPEKTLKKLLRSVTSTAP